MTRLYKYVFCRYMRYYYRVDGDKDTAVFFGIMLMSVTNWFVIFSLLIIFYPNCIDAIPRNGVYSYLSISFILSVFYLPNWLYLIKINSLNKEYYKEIEEYEQNHKYSNVSFYGYFVCLLLFFIGSIILSSMIYPN